MNKPDKNEAVRRLNVERAVSSTLVDAFTAIAKGGVPPGVIAAIGLNICVDALVRGGATKGEIAMLVQATLQRIAALDILTKPANDGAKS